MKSVIALVTIFRGPTGEPALDIHHQGGATNQDQALIILLLDKLVADMKGRFFAENLKSVLADPNLEGPNPALRLEKPDPDITDDLIKGH